MSARLDHLPDVPPTSVPSTGVPPVEALSSAARGKDVAASPRALRLGFLGLGWIGRTRLDAICACAGEALSVAVVADADAQRRRAAAEAYPGAVAVASLEEMLERQIDGVVIATPNAGHAAQAIACLASGVPVFCQKPLATNAADAARVIAAARSTDRLLGIDWCYRYVDGMPELRQRIRAGELGEITAIDLAFHNAYGPDKAWCHDRRLAGGGCLLDLGVHLIDLASWLQEAPRMRLVSSALYAGGLPLHGTAPTAVDVPVEDLAYAELRQESGAIVRLACSWHAHAGCDALIEARIFGTRGGAAWRNVAGSFYDFHVDVFHGAARERIGTCPDEWGPRALHEWLQRLRHDPSFDPAIASTCRDAELIDEMYRA